MRFANILLEMEAATREQEKSSIFSGYRWMAGLQIAQFLLGFFLSIVLARLLSPAIYGVFAMSFIIVQFLQTIEGWCLEYTLVQHSKKDSATESKHFAYQIEREIETAFWFNLGLSFLFTGLISLLMPLFVQYFQDTRIETPLFLLAWSFPISALSFPHRVHIQRTLQLKKSAWIEFCAFIGAAILAFVHAFWHPSVNSLILLAISRIGFRSFLLWIFVSWKPIFSFDWQLLKPLFPSATAFVLNESLTYWQQVIPHSIIGRQLKAHPLGIFRQGLNISQQSFQVLYQIIARTVFPHLASIREQQTVLIRYFQVAFYAVAFVTLISSGFLITFAPEIIFFLFGQKWIETIPILQILALSPIFLSLQVLIRESLYALGNAKREIGVHILHLLGILGLLIFLQPLSLSAYSWIIVGGTFFTWLATQFQLNRLLTLSWFISLKPLFSLGLGIAIPSILLLWLKQDHVEWYSFLGWVFVWFGMVFLLLSLTQHQFIHFLYAPESGSKRIAHISTVHTRHDPRIFYKELQSLQKAGFDAHFIVQHSQDEIINGIQIHALPLQKGRWTRLKIQPKTLRQALKLRASIYHIHDPELIPLLWCLKRFTNAKVIYDMHENYEATHPNWDGKLIGLLEKWCFKWADHIILASESLSPIVAQYRVEHTILPNYSLDLPIKLADKSFDFAQDRQGAKNCILLYTGVMASSRGLSLFVALGKAIRTANMPIQLRLVGKCFEENAWHHFMQDIENEKLTEIISIKGGLDYVPISEMQEDYAAAHFGLCFMEDNANYTNTIPTKFYEYLAHNLPILCSNHPKWQHFIETHDVGNALPHDATMILHTIANLIEDTDRYEELCRNAQNAATRFSWSAIEEELVAVYASKRC